MINRRSLFSFLYMGSEVNDLQIGCIAILKKINISMKPVNVYNQDLTSLLLLKAVIRCRRILIAPAISKLCFLQQK